jgi:hypothetical protein
VTFLHAEQQARPEAHESFAVPVLMIVLACLAVIRVLRSSIAPAISAGVLPIALDERHWTYPVAIFIGLLGLAALVWIRRRLSLAMPTVSAHSTEASIDHVCERKTGNRFWLFSLIAFVTVLSFASQFTGLRFILLPLIVMAYEVLGHPEARFFFPYCVS